VEVEPVEVSESQVASRRSLGCRLLPSASTSALGPLLSILLLRRMPESQRGSTEGTELARHLESLGKDGMTLQVDSW